MKVSTPRRIFYRAKVIMSMNRLYCSRSHISEPRLGRNAKEIGMSQINACQEARIANFIFSISFIVLCLRLSQALQPI